MFPKGFFGILGWLLVRLRYVVVLFWVVVAVAAYLYLPPISGNTTGSISDLVPESAPAAKAQAQAEKSLSGPVEAPAILVFSNPNGFTNADLEKMAQGIRQLNGPDPPYRLTRAVPLAIENSSDPTRIGRELLGRKALPVLLFFESGISPTGITTGVRETKQAVQSPGPLRTEVTGITPVQDDTNNAIQSNLGLVTAATAFAIFLIVAFTYRSPVAPLIPLASIGLATFLTLRILVWVAVNQGINVPTQVEPIIVVLLFGVGTDYALFLLSRTRQALGDGADSIEAARLSVERVGGVLFSSAAVLIAAFALLVLAQLSIYRALGPGLGLALGMVFIVTLTLVPALLAIVGPFAFGRRPVWNAPPLARASRRLRPGFVAGVLVVALTLAASGIFGLKVGFDQLGNLPANAPSVRGYEELTRQLPGGVLAPVNVVVRGENLGAKSAELRRLESGLQNELLKAGGSAVSFGPQYAGQIPGLDFIAPDGSAARILLIFYGNPYSPAALDQAGRLQENLPALIDQAGLEGASGVVQGQTAFAASARNTSDADLVKLAPLVFAVSFLVLGLLLRTPVAPVYLLGATVLSFAATLGLCTVLFQGILGQGGVVYYVPFALFLLLIALGSDYNIFIMAAIREEARTKPLQEAVPAALARTGPTINAAGLALATSFVLLTLIPLRDFFQIGVAVALGVLLDAFVIRDSPRPSPRPPRRPQRFLACEVPPLMPVLSRREFLLGVAALAAAGSVPAWLLLGRRNDAASPANSSPEHVILVDWDGFDPAYLNRAPTPNIDALTARGSLSTAKSTFQTISNPARASMSTGAYPEIHGNAAYYYDDKTGEAVGETRFLAAETITEALAAAGKTAVSVQWYMVEDHGTSAGDPDHLYIQPDGPFQSRVDVAVEVLGRRPVNSGGRMVTVPKVPDLLAVYGSDLDALGSREGPDSPNIGPLLAEMDRQLGRLVQASKDVGIYEKTAFILTSDHGMTTWNRSLLEDSGRLTATGYRVEVVPVGRTADPGTEVILVPDATRTAQVSLRGPGRHSGGPPSGTDSLRGSATHQPGPG